MTLLKKIKVEMTNWQDGVNFDIPIMGVRRAKISWMYFTTSDADQLLLTLKCAEFAGSGYLPNTNNRYFLSVPLDKSSDVTCVYTNFYQEFDHDQEYSTGAIHALNFEALINDLPTTSITPSNPLAFEIRLYS
jgi:hypothetical protein